MPRHYFSQQNRFQLGVILLSVLACFSSVLFLVKSWRDFHRHDVVNEALLQEKRLTPLLPYLPPRGVIGYVDRFNQGNAPATAVNAGYYAAQYILAPRVLEYGDKPDLVIANQPPSPHLKHWVDKKNWILLRDNGQGVALSQRRNQR